MWNVGLSFVVAEMEIGLELDMERKKKKEKNRDRIHLTTCMDYSHV